MEIRVSDRFNRYVLELSGKDIMEMSPDLVKEVFEPRAIQERLYCRKRIAELEQENAELRRRLESRTVDMCRVETTGGFW